ncbi:MAG: winged helix transcriptional response regulator [Rhizobacter sp.]|nr:winged helix transcriptional response regulator [Rhizobacter sp.]
MRVLLVEDDPMLGDAVRQALRDACYAVDWILDGQAASVALTHHEFELILLDLGLPGRDGLDVLRTLRARGDSTPVLVITARDAVEQRIEGLDGGADDYLVKPFAVGELLARLRALQRRRTGTGSPGLSNGALSLNVATKTVTLAGNEHTLSRREFALLRELLVRPGAVLSRAELESRIYGWGEEVESNVVEYIIHSLRRKLGVEAIRNVRGLGWMVERHGNAGGVSR